MCSKIIVQFVVHQLHAALVSAYRLFQSWFATRCGRLHEINIFENGGRSDPKLRGWTSTDQQFDPIARNACQKVMQFAPRSGGSRLEEARTNTLYSYRQGGWSG